jgi:AsmA-like protein
MRRLFKWALRFVLAAVVLVVLLLVFKDTILRAVVEHRIRDRTGLEVKIGKFSSSLFSQVFTLENVKVYNPAEFGGTLFLSVPELHLELNATELAQRRIRVSLARLNLAELDIVRNELGQTNVFAIVEKVKLRTKKRGGVQKLFGDFKFTGVETLNLTLGKVRYIDLKEPRKSSERALEVKDQVWRDLTSKAVLETDLIMLWLVIGNKMPISVDDIIRFYLYREKKQPPGMIGGEPVRKTNAPPRL